MKLWLVGLTDQDAGAIEVMTGLSGETGRCLVQPRSISLSLPVASAMSRLCDACVIDLFGIGLRRHTPERQADLIELLAGRPAVIGYWGEGGGWLEAAPAIEARSQVIWLHFPPRSAEMKKALSKLSALVGQGAPQVGSPTPERGTAGSTARGVSHAASRVAIAAKAPPQEAAAPAPAPTSRSWLERVTRVRSQMSERPSSIRTPEPAQGQSDWSDTAPQTSTAAVNAPVVVQPVGAPVLSGRTPLSLAGGGYAALCASFPELPSLPLFRLLWPVFTGAQIYELQGSGGLVLLIDPQAGWVASNVAPTAVRKLLQSPDVLRGVVLHSVASDAVSERLRAFEQARQREPRMALDGFFWGLIDRSLRGHPLRSAKGLDFQLTAMPNLTQFSDAPPEFVQLAVLALRMPQSLQSLQRLFGPENEALIARFVILSVVCGLANVFEVPAASVAPVAPEPAPAKPKASAPKPQRGFFKSLLEKLF